MYTARGVSVVDYFLVPHDPIGNCNNFHVTSMTDLLDHYQLKYLLGYHSKAPDRALLNFELCVMLNPLCYVMVPCLLCFTRLVLSTIYAKSNLIF